MYGSDRDHHSLADHSEGACECYGLQVAKALHMDGIDDE